MGVIGDAVGSLFGGGSSDDAGDAAIEASKIDAKYNREALQYLKDRERLPMQFRDEAMKQMAGAYGIPGGASAQEFMASAEASPMYRAIMGNLPQMEEAILRNQSATGALRGGATDMMLAENQRNLRANALGGVLGGIQNMAQLPSNDQAIASGIANIGNIKAQGIIGQAQSNQMAQQNNFGNLLGLGNLGLSAYSAFSDPRLKSNPVKIGEVDGLQIYEWDWNEEAANLGLYGKGYGPMADEIIRFMPERIENRNGYMYVRAA